MHYISFLKILNKIILCYILNLLSVFRLWSYKSICYNINYKSIFTLILNYKISRKFSQFQPNIKINDLDPAMIKSAIIFSLMIFVGFLTTKIDILMISLFGGVSEVGKYGVSYKLIRQGMVLRNMTSVAFFPMVVKYLKVQKISQSKIISISILLFLIFLIFSIFISFYSEILISVLFGDEYIASGEILKYLVFFLPISGSFNLYNLLHKLSIRKNNFVFKNF